MACQISALVAVLLVAVASAAGTHFHFRPSTNPSDNRTHLSPPPPLLTVAPIPLLADRPQARIIGGTQPARNDFRHIASVQTRSRHLCGGAIVGARWVITSGRCVVNLAVMDDVFVRTGTHTHSSGGVRHSVDNIVVHPQFVSGPRLNDIALIHTVTTIATNTHTHAIALPTSDVTSGQATFAGWGQADLEHRGRSPQLRALATTIVPAARCTTALASAGLGQFLRRTNICTNAGEGHGMCNGDLGSPLNVGDRLVGIASFGVTCATGVPDVYTRVFSYVAWIRETAV